MIDLKLYGNPYLETAEILLFLPCSAKKPYKLSVTHQYVHKKLEENLSQNILDKIQINTISEVKGIIPEHLEDSIFKNAEDFYDYYPTEFDVYRTAGWLVEFIANAKKTTNAKIFVVYATAPIFREIAIWAKRIAPRSHIKLLPNEVVKRKAMFEFRKKINTLIDFLKDT